MLEGTEERGTSLDVKTDVQQRVIGVGSVLTLQTLHWRERERL